MPARPPPLATPLASVHAELAEVARRDRLGLVVDDVRGGARRDDRAGDDDPEPGALVEGRAVRDLAGGDGHDVRLGRGADVQELAALRVPGRDVVFEREPGRTRGVLARDLALPGAGRVGLERQGGERALALLAVL